MNEFFNKLKYFEEVEKEPAQIYYHYTSLSALYNIVTNQTLWLTSLKSSNDKRELYYKPEQFIQDFRNVCSTEKHENTKRWLESYSRVLDAHYDDFIKLCKLKRTPYALCLSKKKDNLTHWDRYAAKCSGVCIGINVSALKIYFQRMAIGWFAESLFSIAQITYNQTDIEKRIRNFVAGSINSFMNPNAPHSKDLPPLTESQKTNIAINSLAITYLEIAKFSKNPSFVDEDEVRFYFDAESIKATRDLIRQLDLEMQSELSQNISIHFDEIVQQLEIQNDFFTLTQSGIRSYRKLCLKNIWGSGTIPEIILGPMCVQNRNELLRFLNANGLQGTKVSVSKVPIR